MVKMGYAKHENISKWILVFWGLTTFNAALTLGDGKESFQQRCAACHRVGGGRLVGPDLAGVTDRRSEGWLVKFIKSSQAVIKSGDPAAKAIFDEYKIVMPDQSLSDDQIKEVLAYVKEAGSSAQSASASAGTTASPEATPEEIAKGQDLFQGKIRFSAGGPSCISCHNVENGAVFGGGILAKELTTVYSRMGEQGVRAILSSPPFPVMTAAFEGKAISEDEIRALIGFLKLADKESTMQQPREYAWTMFGAGSGGVIVLLGFFSFIGGRRKKGSVNQEIYDRQVKSE